jgi:2-oxoglutarate dehydrogenase E2 component (dihydrolipoamide succinyltransferase)
MLEVPAPVDGILKEIIKKPGDVVQANEVIAVIEEGEGKKAKSEPKTEESAKDSEKTSQKSAPALSPSVRRVVQEHDIDVSKVQGTGKGGRITKENVIASQSESVHDVAAAGERTEKRVPMTRIRARIAERLLDVTQNTAMLTTFNEINLKNIMELRNKYKDKFEKTHNIRLGFMSFFVKAAVEALKRSPAVNASIDGNDIVYHGYFDIGVAVSTDRGLVVPVIRDADQLSLADIEKQIADYAAKARNGKLTLEEMQGGTFSITNGGVFGSLLATPIINAPQSAILGMHKIEERPVVIDGQIVIRPMMYVALSYDHRIIDGKESVTFLVMIKDFLEDPARLLLEI